MRECTTILGFFLSIFISVSFINIPEKEIDQLDHFPSCLHNEILNFSATEELEFKNNFTFRRNPYKIQKVVIDAGHGGKDSGCRGRYGLEKNIALNIALQLGSLIEYHHPEVEVIYTRKEDVFIPLFKRIDIANKNEADLFISIHCNSIAHKNTRGSETYVMGLHRAEENLAVAKRENSSILFEKDYQKNYDGYDPQSTEGHIILSMFQNAYLDQSIQFANLVETSFTKRTPLNSRGVKQAGFVVLRQATMPSVLIEAGFLSHSKEEKYLLSTKGQNEIADAIVKAFTDYKRDMELEERHLAELNKEIKMNGAAESIMNEPAPKKEIVTAPVKSTQKETPAPKKEAQKVEPELKKQNNAKTVTAKTQTKPAQPQVSSAIVYKVQVAASMKKPIELQEPLLSMIEDIEIRKEDDMYKYLYGNYSNLEKASKAKTMMKEKGFNGAFVVAYQGHRRVKI